MNKQEKKIQFDYDDFLFFLNNQAVQDIGSILVSEAIIIDKFGYICIKHEDDTLTRLIKGEIFVESS